MANTVRASRTRGRVMIEGPLRVGSDVLLSGNSMRGDVELVKRIPISADGAYSFRLPGCNIVEMIYNNEVATQSTAASLRVGTSADNLLYGSVAISAVNRYEVRPSAINLLAITSGATIIVDVTAVGTAGTQVGSLYVRYQQTGGAD